MKTTTMMKAMMMAMMMSATTMMMAATGTMVNNKNDKGHGPKTEVTGAKVTSTGERGHITSGNNAQQGWHQGSQQATQQGWHQSTPQMTNHGKQQGWINGKDIRGYEGRVHYDKGIWSYYRNGRWYHYNHYIDVRQYFSHKLGHWGKGISINMRF